MCRRDEKEGEGVNTDCTQQGHIPDVWTTEGDIQVRRCKVCNLITVTTEISKP